MLLPSRVAGSQGKSSNRESSNRKTFLWSLMTSPCNPYTPKNPYICELSYQCWVQSGNQPLIKILITTNSPASGFCPSPSWFMHFKKSHWCTSCHFVPSPGWFLVVTAPFFPCEVGEGFLEPSHYAFLSLAATPAAIPTLPNNLQLPRASVYNKGRPLKCWTETQTEGHRDKFWQRFDMMGNSFLPHKLFSCAFQALAFSCAFSAINNEIWHYLLVKH